MHLQPRDSKPPPFGSGPNCCLLPASRTQALPSPQRATGHHFHLRRPPLLHHRLRAPTLPNRHFPRRRIKIGGLVPFSKRWTEICEIGYAESYAVYSAPSSPSPSMVRSPVQGSCSCTARIPGSSCRSCQTFRYLRPLHFPISDRSIFGPARFKVTSGVFYFLSKGS